MPSTVSESVSKTDERYQGRSLGRVCGGVGCKVTDHAGHCLAVELCELEKN